MATGMSFQSIFLIPFSFCFNIATKHVYKFSKGCMRLLLSYINFCGKWGELWPQV